LDAIGSLGPQSVILIDDARLFLCPPPFPHEISHWPELEAIVEKLKALSGAHELMIANDVILFYPKSIRATVRDYAYRNSIDWLQVSHKSRICDAVKQEFEALLTEFEGVQRQLVEKDAEIDRQVKVSEERAKSLREKEAMIADLHSIAEERSRVLHLINDELVATKNHWSYRRMVKATSLLERMGIARR
jgi:hypothetical protein